LHKVTIIPRGQALGVTTLLPDDLTQPLLWIGLLLLINEGGVFAALSSDATAICGFTAGLDPPIAGWTWHPAQLLRLNPGPRPTPLSMVPETESTS
jgi:hypothetical protein